MLTVGLFVAIVGVALAGRVFYARMLSDETRARVERWLRPEKMENRGKWLAKDVAADALKSPSLLTLSLWVRLLLTVLVIAMLAAANLSPDELPGGRFWESYMVLSALAAWAVGYVWTYQVFLDGTRLVVPTWLFKTRELDLNELERVDQRHSLMLVLHMENGARVAVPKYLHGRATLMRALALHTAP
ncbi:MAG: hypothetical protein AAGH70_03100 [Pseudomonadota bacterium]